MEHVSQGGFHRVAVLVLTAAAVGLGTTSSASAHDGVVHDPELVQGSGPSSSPLAGLIESATSEDPAQPDLGASDPNFEPKTIRGFGYAESRTLGGTYEMQVGEQTVQFDKHNAADEALGNSSSYALDSIPPAPPACTSSGRRFVPVYAYPQGAPNDVARQAAGIRAAIWQVNGKLVQESLLASGASRAAAIRVDCDGLGQVEVPSVPVPTTCARNGLDPGLSPDGSCNPDYAGHIAYSVERALGTPEGNSSVKYVIFYDKAGTGLSGVGFGYFSGDGDLKTRKLNPNRNYTTSAVMYREFWGSLTVVHEMGHLMGAVQNTAPHSSGASHCVDGNDIMCYADVRSSTFTDTNPDFCPNGSYNALGFRYDSALGMPFDCGYDDYFRTSPGNGYLDSHWNVGGWENDLLAFTPEWPTPVDEPGYGPPDLSISQKTQRLKTKRRGVRFLISVRNRGAGPTVGETGVLMELPKRARVETLSGTGWRCDAQRRIASCTRTKPLQPDTDYPPIKLDLLLARRAAAKVRNVAAVFGASDVSRANNVSTAHALAASGRS